MFAFFVLLTVAQALSLSGSFGRYPVKLCFGVPEARYFSCKSPVEVALDSCCYENYGVIMQTQFWDYNPKYAASKRDVEDTAEVEAKRDWDFSKLGDFVTNKIENAIGELEKKKKGRDASKVFTIHGLWNDLCDGSYNQYCNPSLEIPDSASIEDILVNKFHRQDLYDTMLTFWLNTAESNVQGGGNAELWQHEFNKHGTCFNTLMPKCFNFNYTQYENAVAYYQKAVEVWTTLPTYEFLKAAGIKPSAKKQVSLAAVENALALFHGGKQVYVGCTDGAISEIWYYHAVMGNVLNGIYEPTDSLTKSNCPLAVWYYPKD